ncbi:MAG: hypothetical protein U5Q03_01050 [Bacteroidota bacterium]|nr:hypothetical protein [Bacteroidota bacterium]
MKIFTAEFGHLKRDTMQYFSSYSQELNENSTQVQFANHYSTSADIDFDALVIMDRSFVQLNRPFPYYTSVHFQIHEEKSGTRCFYFPFVIKLELEL